MTPHPHPIGSATMEEAVALVEAASGADSAAIDALESVVVDLRRARRARRELGARVPTEMLRQVLLERARDRG